MMKARTFIGISISMMLMILVGVTGCNNGDNPVNDPEQNDIIDTNDNNSSEEDGMPEMSDVRDSGCMNRTRDADLLGSTLVLTKEGDIISGEIQGFYCNCAVDYFDVDLDYSKGKGTPDTLSIDIRPVIPTEMDCWCPYTIYFTVRDVRTDHFFLNCWLYTGMVSFRDYDQVVLEISKEKVETDGSSYLLYSPGQQAMFYEMAAESKGELHIPSTVNYDGQDYSVLSFNRDAFHINENVTKLILPKSIRRIGEQASEYIVLNSRFRNLENIEVEPGCPTLSSVDGVLYSGNHKTLYCHPVANKRTSYKVIDGVEKISSYAFDNCRNLTSIRLPESVTTICAYAFQDCKNLESIYIFGRLDRDFVKYWGFYGFEGIGSAPTVYVPESEVDFFKTIYKGKVLPLPK